MRLSDGTVDRLRDAASWPELPPGRYELRELIGRGGMGAVYRATDRTLGRDVALKVSNAPVARHALDVRLRREAEVLSSLEHPGIVPVHDAGALADGRWFYVMKLVRGRTLVEHVRTLTSEASVLGVFERIAETVAFAHAATIVHRDLKPSNVMIGSFGEVLVLDWGVAKVLGESRDTTGGNVLTGDDLETSDGMRIGTPGFMAPEQQSGNAAGATAASDVYSLGALLFWMLTGATAPALRADVMRALGALATPPSRRLRAIITKCLSADSHDRYTDAAHVVADIARYRAGQAVVAYPESWLYRTWRWFERYRTFILLIAAYLVMRAAFAWFQR